jgi:hypothetical protein
VRLALHALFLILGVFGLILGAWPLLTGRNYPGLLGRGFTKGDNLRLSRAPAIYFRATGAVAASAGFLMLAVSVVMELPASPTVAQLSGAAVLFAAALVALFGSLAWMLVIAYRHKLFRWNAP